MSKSLEDDAYDGEVYLQRARDRKAAEEEALTSRAKSRKLLSAREQSLDLGKNAGTRSYVSVEMVGDREVKRGAGFYCEVCQYTSKDSQAYMAHLNSRNHLTNAGFDMRVARASVDQVKSRFAKHSKKRSIPMQELASKVHSGGGNSGSGANGSGSSSSSRGSSSSSRGSSSGRSDGKDTQDNDMGAPHLKRQKTSKKDEKEQPTSCDASSTKLSTSKDDSVVAETNLEKEEAKVEGEEEEESEATKFQRLMGFGSFK